nr:hypothetical protein [Nonlabens sp. Hel1_33_55]
MDGKDSRWSGFSREKCVKTKSAGDQFLPIVVCNGIEIDIAFAKA